MVQVFTFFFSKTESWNILVLITFPISSYELLILVKKPGFNNHVNHLIL
jgi:hypothetical protein